MTVEIGGSPIYPIGIQRIYNSFEEVRCVIDTHNKDGNSKYGGLMKISDAKYHINFDNFNMVVDLLGLLVEILGKQSYVHIHSGIYEFNGNEHDTFPNNIDSYIETDGDFIEIKGSKDNPINLSQIHSVYNYMQKQIEECNKDRNYFYEGMSYYGKREIYQIKWGY
jgi:hypothetical protein